MMYLWFCAFDSSLYNSSMCPHEIVKCLRQNAWTNKYFVHSIAARLFSTCIWIINCNPLASLDVNLRDGLTLHRQRDDIAFATGDGAVLTLHTIAFSPHNANHYTHIQEAAFRAVYFCHNMKLQEGECQAAWFSKYRSRPRQSRRWAHNCQSLWKSGGKRQESTHKPADAGCIILYGGAPQHVYTHSARQLWASWACLCLCFS